MDESESVAHVSFCEDENGRYEEERWVGGEREKDKRLPEVMRRLNSISLWEICSTRQITSLKKVFIIGWQWGPCAVAWLHACVELFVFIMWCAAVNVWDDLFSSCFSAHLSRSLSTNAKWLLHCEIWIKTGLTHLEKNMAFSRLLMRPWRIQIHMSLVCSAPH